MCVCVCVCVHANVFVRVCGCVCVCLHTRAHAYERACLRARARASFTLNFMSKNEHLTQLELLRSGWDAHGDVGTNGMLSFAGNVLHGSEGTLVPVATLFVWLVSIVDVRHVSRHGHQVVS